MLEKLTDLFKNEAIQDIYLLGFVDIENRKANFSPDMRCYYFEFGDQYIELESIEQYSKLSVRIVDSVHYKFEIDEDMFPCTTSVNQLILMDSMSAKNIVNRFVIYGLECDTADQIVCHSLQLNLENGQELFIDPSFYYGINIGGAEQRRFWKENLINPTIVEEIQIEV